MYGNNVVVLKLTEDQQEHIKRLTGKNMSMLRIEAVEEQATGRIVPGEPLRHDRLGGAVN